ncbi:hypothetical protein DJ019_10020 [Phenylobacterium kunshanense]|uniref:Glycosyltransferase RgtA/B/C/D-like domain-containing protein n=1 Tax=Phenylobacterium kunshanense TaxID=1445034 RepID=A0A328BIS8_9CAUL|nr:hypothetical protein DJ019_10020 [Phenylobacterium kunshanense]
MVQYTGILFFNRQLTGRASLAVAVLSIPLLYSFIFTWGFMNFLLGLGLVFWGAGWWLLARDKPRIAIPVACVIAIAIFLTHGVAFALYGLLLGGLELGIFATAARRSLADLMRSMLALAVQAIAPAILFAISPTSGNPQGLTNADEAVRRLASQGALNDRMLELIWYRLTTVVRVAEGPSFAFDLVAAGLVTITLALLFMRKSVTLPRLVWPALAIGALLVLITPPALFGVGYVSDRMPLFLAMLAVASLRFSEMRTDRVAAALTMGLAALVAVRLAALTVAWQPYRDDLAAFRRVAEHIPPHSLVGFVNLANDHRIDGSSRCEMYGPLLIPLAGQATPIFAFGTQQPITIVGPLKAAISALPPPSGSRSGLFRGQRRIAAMAQAGKFEFALICAPERLSAPLPASAVLTAQEGRFALIRLSGAPAAQR